MASWKEQRRRALEEAVDFLCRSQDAGAEGGVRSATRAGWAAAGPRASARASAAMAAYAVAHDRADLADRARSLASWVLRHPREADRGGEFENLRLIHETATCLADGSLHSTMLSRARAIAREDDRLEPVVALAAHLLNGVDAREWPAADRDLLRRVAEPITASPGSFMAAFGAPPVMSESIVAAAKVLKRAVDLNATAEAMPALRRIASWFVNRFEVRGHIDEGGESARWLATEYLCDLIDVWQTTYRVDRDSRALNSALHLLDVIQQSQCSGVRWSVRHGSVPERLHGRGDRARDGDVAATAALARVLLAEEDVLLDHGVWTSHTTIEAGS